jgi:putative membrane protein (TIGR04086 family)
VRWRAVLLGLAVAVVIGYLSNIVFAPTPGSAATIVGIGIGGFVAGKRANAAGLYHGALVGLGWIALETLALVPTVRYADDLVTDSLIVIAMDVATLAAGAFGGALARRGLSSSSDTGRGR